MTQHTNNLIVGQGLAGTTLAWRLREAGQSVVLVDKSESVTASRVAAGLITPWSGRRMTQSSDFDENWIEARDFYRSVENRLGQSLFTDQSMLRLFVHRSDETIFEQRREESGSQSLKRWSGQLQPQGPSIEGCRMQPAGRLNVRRYLQASIDFFSDLGQWFQLELNLPDSLVIHTDYVQVPELQLVADRVIFCQGATTNPWFEGIPNNPSRGDIINVRLDKYQATDVVHHSIWLVPEADGTVTAGSTYDWKFIQNTPTAAGRREILRAMNRFIEGPIQVNHHTAAVRPTMKDYRPVIDRHETHDRLWIFNGLGSRGVLAAPRLARLLAESMVEASQKLPDDISPERLRRTPERRSLTDIAQARIIEAIKPGDVVIDATVGNGYDTCFLANNVGGEGQVYGFDVQQPAIESTQKRLDAAGLKNVELIQRSHSEIKWQVTVPVSAAMFNLGYLPRSDHSIVTRAETTIAALEQIVDLLCAGGIITILAYRGHDGGMEESKAVEGWLQNQLDCTVERIDSRPARAASPVLFVLMRR
ncbi:MAG: FAD-dependent oxidoreductase [Planctomycetaceae bacterium]